MQPRTASLGHSFRRNRRRLGAGLFVVVAVTLAWGYWADHQAATPTAQAHSLCQLCGLEPSEVDGLIETMRDRLATGMTREELLQAFYDTFDEPEEGLESVCRACAVAVLDEAEGS